MKNQWKLCEYLARQWPKWRICVWPISLVVFHIDLYLIVLFYSQKLKQDQWPFSCSWKYWKYLFHLNLKKHLTIFRMWHLAHTVHHCYQQNHSNQLWTFVLVFSYNNCMLLYDTRSHISNSGQWWLLEKASWWSYSGHCGRGNSETQGSDDRRYENERETEQETKQVTYCDEKTT